MSYGNAHCSLYVACETKEQAEALYHKFNQDNPKALIGTKTDACSAN